MLALLRQIRRRVLLHRRLLAALCAGVAVAATVAALRPPEPPTRPVAVAARALAAGVVLQAEDLVIADYPVDLAPAGARGAIAPLVGASVAAPVGAGEPLTRARLIGAPLRRGYVGLVATPIRVSDPGVAALLRPGDVVNLVAATGEADREPVIVATGARVIAVPPVADADRIGAEGALVLFGVPPSQAAAAAAAPSAGYVTVVWDR